ncbi:hypothetical protein GCM10010493_75450 [Streptomyces lavendulae subsp. grasserius]
MPKAIDAALRSQAVRLVTEHRSECSAERALHIQVADSLGAKYPALSGVEGGKNEPGIIGAAPRNQS